MELGANNAPSSASGGLRVNPLEQPDETPFVELIETYDLNNPRSRARPNTVRASRPTTSQPATTELVTQKIDLLITSTELPLKTSTAPNGEVSPRITPNPTASHFYSNGSINPKLVPEDEGSLPSVIFVACVVGVGLLCFIAICALYLCLRKYVFKQKTSQINIGESEDSKFVRESQTNFVARPLRPDRNVIVDDQNGFSQPNQNTFDQKNFESYPGTAKSVQISGQLSRQPIQLSEVSNKSSIGVNGNNGRTTTKSKISNNKPRNRSVYSRRSRYGKEQEKANDTQSRVSSSNQVLVMDKAVITPEMFTPTNMLRSKKEILLYKAASFTE